MTKILVCRVGEDPKVEDIRNPWNFCKTNLCGSDPSSDPTIEAKLFWVKEERVVFYWDEDARSKKLRFNRNVPVVVHGSKGGYAIQEDSKEVFNIRGNFLVTKADSRGDHISLSSDELFILGSILTLPKCARCKTNPLAYPGAVYCGASCSQQAEAGK